MNASLESKPQWRTEVSGDLRPDFATSYQTRLAVIKIVCLWQTSISPPTGEVCDRTANRAAQPSQKRGWGYIQANFWSGRPKFGVRPCRGLHRHLRFLCHLPVLLTN